jgi:hypothetical protein
MVGKIREQPSSSSLTKLQVFLFDDESISLLLNRSIGLFEGMESECEEDLLKKICSTKHDLVKTNVLARRLVSWPIRFLAFLPTVDMDLAASTLVVCLLSAVGAGLARYLLHVKLR